MVDIPLQRPTTALRTITVPAGGSIPASVAATRAQGWHLVSATLVPTGVELRLRRFD